MKEWACKSCHCIWSGRFGPSDPCPECKGLGTTFAMNENTYGMWKPVIDRMKELEMVAAVDAKELRIGDRFRFPGSKLVWEVTDAFLSIPHEFECVLVEFDGGRASAEKPARVVEGMVVEVIEP